MRAGLDLDRKLPNMDLRGAAECASPGLSSVFCAVLMLALRETGGGEASLLDDRMEKIDFRALRSVPGLTGATAALLSILGVEVCLMMRRVGGAVGAGGSRFFTATVLLMCGVSALLARMDLSSSFLMTAY